MWIACLVVILVVAAWMTRVNARYAEREARAKAGPDARVQEVWDAYSSPDDLAAAASAQKNAPVRKLLDEVNPEELRTKNAVVALAIMAARAGRYEPLEALAQQATRIEGGCGEAGALGVLAAAYAGDVELAKERSERSRATMAGCASCGASATAKILMTEVALALDALESGALYGDDGAVDEHEARDEPAAGAATLYVRRAG